MNKNESDFWANDVAKLKAFGLIKRLEDTLEKGTSDCVYCLRFKDEVRAGWVELKRLRAWPAFATTTVMLPHFTLEQLNFLERWGRVGMGAHLLAQVGNDYILWRWPQARAIYEGCNRQKMLALAAVHGNGAFPTGRILRCLTEI